MSVSSISHDLPERIPRSRHLSDTEFTRLLRARNELRALGGTGHATDRDLAILHDLETRIDREIESWR